MSIVERRRSAICFAGQEEAKTMGSLSILGALALLAVGGQSSAQEPVPSYVICQWEGSSAPELFRITPNVWSDWSPKAWRWEARDCYMHINPGWVAGDSLKCAITITDEKYEWTFQGYGAESYMTRTGNRKLTLDRRTGDASYTWSWATSLSNIPPPNHFQDSGALRGTCTAGKDPSLEPKPAPRF
jgi:hypothetical protein